MDIRTTKTRNVARTAAQKSDSGPNKQRQKSALPTRRCQLNHFVYMAPCNIISTGFHNPRYSVHERGQAVTIQYCVISTVYTFIHSTVSTHSASRLCQAWTNGNIQCVAHVHDMGLALGLHFAMFMHRWWLAAVVSDIG